MTYRLSSPSALVILLFASLAGCQDPPQANASENARITRELDEVVAGQARSEANVAEVEAKEENLLNGN